MPPALHAGGVVAAVAGGFVRTTTTRRLGSPIPPPLRCVVAADNGILAARKPNGTHRGRRGQDEIPKSRILPRRRRVPSSSSFATACGRNFATPTSPQGPPPPPTTSTGYPCVGRAPSGSSSFGIGHWTPPHRVRASTRPHGTDRGIASGGHSDGGGVTATTSDKGGSGAMDGDATTANGDGDAGDGGSSPIGDPSYGLPEDIEELHRLAVLSDETSYTDPVTGFMVFTELAALRRGKCCGSTCRHCPYGWENVVRPDERGNKVRRRAKLESGDRVEARRILDRIGTMQAEFRRADVDGAAGGEGGAPSSGDGGGAMRGGGGRRGGTLTKKNVPYTRGGDGGTSSLLTGERRRKDDAVFEAMGTVDELCTFVGVAHAEMTSSDGVGDGVDVEESVRMYGDLPGWLLLVMSRLFDVGTHIAKPKKRRGDVVDSDEDEGEASAAGYDGVGGAFDPTNVDDLELWIDAMTDDLAELTSFILPTGGRASAQCHVCRTVCRRAERLVVSLVDDGSCDPTVLRYLNRLSDFFFTAARYSNMSEGRGEEILYKRHMGDDTQRDRVVASLRGGGKGDGEKPS